MITRRTCAISAREESANERAHRIASIAAEELVRCEGQAASYPDEVLIPQCQVDDHMRDCIDHLDHAGLATSCDTSDGYVLVMFYDVTQPSLPY